MNILVRNYGAGWKRIQGRVNMGKNTGPNKYGKEYQGQVNMGRSTGPSEYIVVKLQGWLNMGESTGPSEYGRQ